ncbi:MAG TPA: HAD family hydrolase [Candidatus Vogelbacteria bacterium]|nr:HAD family hydrolase [Candidatus Vogelbacteria bacterium]
MKDKWYLLSTDEALNKLKTTSKGLARAEVEERLGQYGLNELPEAKPDSFLRIFFRQFQSSLIYILLLAALVVALLGELIDAGIITAVLLLNAIIGSIQEGKAQNTLFALKRFSETEALVLRDGQEILINDKKIVPGDIIILRDGDRAPADARLIWTTNLRVEEATLTGESEPITKTSEVLETDKDNLSPSDQLNMVFKGSYIVGGTAKAVVCSTGLNTIVGGISQKLSDITAELPLKANIRFLSHIIIFLTVVINIFLFLVGWWQGNTMAEMFFIVVAVSVSVIPEGLPVVITLVLATGVWRMGKRNALVKKLQAVEALGQAKIIAVDKTGTITKNELMVSELWLAGEKFLVTGDGYDLKGELRHNDKVLENFEDNLLSLVGKISALSPSARVSFDEEKNSWRALGDPTEAALFVLANKLGFKKDDLEGKYPLISEIPFDSKIKYKATVHKIDDKNFMSVIGAPEILLARAKYFKKENETIELTEQNRSHFSRVIADMSARGLRVLAIGVNENSPQGEITDDDLPTLTLVGLCGMSDVLRLEALEAVKRTKEAGMKVVMITGDHAITAKAIARQVGIYSDGDEVITGDDLAHLNDEALDKKIAKTTVFARVTPEHKLRIIEAYKRRKEIIAMTGDGVNDALSLVAADLGVAMGKIGTEVAKEAADIVLLDDNFSSIVSAVEEGRSIYQTIRKVVLYLFSTSIGEVLTICGAILLGWPLPLLASQIIWLNFVTDGFLVAALAFEPKEKNLLGKDFRQPPKWLVDKKMGFRIFLMSTTMMVGTLIFFGSVLPAGASAITDEQFDLTYAWTISLTVLAVYQWFNVWNCRSDKESVFSMRFWDNKYLILATIVVVFLHLSIIYIPLGQTIMRTSALSFSDWFFVIVIASSIIAVEEIRKIVSRLKIS